jgi:hypothetical protein
MPHTWMLDFASAFDLSVRNFDCTCTKAAASLRTDTTRERLVAVSRCDPLEHRTYRYERADCRALTVGFGVSAIRQFGGDGVVASQELTRVDRVDR